MSLSQSENKPTIFVKEVLLTLWYRQKALIQCLEEKGLVEEKEYSENLEEYLEKLIKPYLKENNT